MGIFAKKNKNDGNSSRTNDDSKSSKKSKSDDAFSSADGRDLPTGMNSLDFLGETGDLLDRSAPVVGDQAGPADGWHLPDIASEDSLVFGDGPEADLGSQASIDSFFGDTPFSDDSPPVPVASADDASVDETSPADSPLPASPEGTAHDVRMDRRADDAKSEDAADPSKDSPSLSEPISASGLPPISAIVPEPFAVSSVDDSGAASDMLSARSDFLSVGVDDPFDTPAPTGLRDPFAPTALRDPASDVAAGTVPALETDAVFKPPATELAPPSMPEPDRGEAITDEAFPAIADMVETADLDRPKPSDPDNIERASTESASDHSAPAGSAPTDSAPTDSAPTDSAPEQPTSDRRDATSHQSAGSAAGPTGTQANVHLEVLGLDPGATWEQIAQTHRDLMIELDDQPSADKSDISIALKREMNTAYASLRLMAVL